MGRNPGLLSLIAILMYLMMAGLPALSDGLIEESANVDCEEIVVLSLSEPLTTLTSNSDGYAGLESVTSCVPRSQCCKICGQGKACGNTCIRRDYNCRAGRGCACNSAEVCRD